MADVGRIAELYDGALNAPAMDTGPIVESVTHKSGAFLDLVTRGTGDKGGACESMRFRRFIDCLQQAGIE